MPPDHFASIATLKPIKPPRVWFVQEPMVDFNYANLADYGEVIFMLRHQDRPGLNPGNAIRILRGHLRDWKQEDYLCSYGGDMLGMLMTGQVIHDLFPNKPIRWLRWNRGRNEDGFRDMKNGHYEAMRYSLIERPMEEAI